LLLFIYRRQTKTKEEAKLDPEALKQLRMQGGGEQLEYVKVQDIVSKYFCKADEVSLKTKNYFYFVVLSKSELFDFIRLEEKQTYGFN